MGMKRNLVIAGVAAVVAAGFVLAYVLVRPAEPTVQGFMEGREIVFMHTEVSDPKVAGILTGMIRSPVFTVPSLAQVPKAALATVYVFTNGIKDGGPLKFQRDIFDNPPDTPGYSPLREIVLVTWNAGRDPRILKSVTELMEAEKKGELTLKRTGIVVNVPLVTWPGGHR